MELAGRYIFAAFTIFCFVLNPSIFFTQWDNLTHDFSVDNHPREEYRSIWSGWSGLSYVVVAFAPGNKLHLVWVCQGVASFLADYVYIGLPSASHGVDRWLSMFCTLHVVYCAQKYRLWRRFVFGCFITLLTQYFARLSFGKGWSNHWIFFHTLCHLNGGYICCKVYADCHYIKSSKSKAIH